MERGFVPLPVGKTVPNALLQRVVVGDGERLDATRIWRRAFGSSRRAGRSRPIDSDSCRSRAKFESREFPFEIKSEEI